MSSNTIANPSGEQPTLTTYRRGCLFYVRRGLKWFGLLLIALVVVGVVFQSIATEADKRAYAPRGQLYNVNGHQMHLVCMGEGSPTVVFELGGFSESLWAYQVQHQLAAHTQVCAYDRAGLGWSEPGSGSRDAITLTQELHTLLEVAGVPAPYVIAGHSFGGILARIYAAQYPEDVNGLVLIDSGLLIPKQFASQAEFDEWKSSNNVLQALLWGMTRTGLMRLILTGQFEAWGYPSDIAKEMIALRSTNQVFDTDYAERIPTRWMLNEASAAAENLGDLPIAVLWATEGFTFSDEDMARILALHEEIAAYSTNSLTRYVEGADHGSILGNELYAKQVTDAILAVIEAAQTGQPLSQVQ